MKLLKIALGIFLVVVVVEFIGSHSQSGTASQAQVAAAGPTCGVADIAIDKLRGVTEDGGYARITGRLTNHCAVAIGPEVKITVYNKAGDILKVDDIWPASIKNIPANTEFPFKWLDHVDGFSRYTVNVIDVKTWN